jgi:hypothetical protein
MHRGRLNKMIRFLETQITSKQFDMCGFGHGCGTAGCVAGWSPEVPALYALGVRTDGNDGAPDLPVLSAAACIALGVKHEYISYRYTGLEVLELVFQLSNKEAHWLFVAENYPSGNPSLRSVITRMKGFVDGTKKPPVRKLVRTINYRSQ